MNAPNWLLQGVVFGFIIGVTIVLLCGMVLAGEAIQDLVTGKWTLRGDNGVFVAVCNESLTTCASPCKKKMAEAMKALAPFISRPLVDTEDPATRLDKELAAKEQFRAVMKECVL